MVSGVNPRSDASKANGTYFTTLTDSEEISHSSEYVFSCLLGGRGSMKRVCISPGSASEAIPSFWAPLIFEGPCGTRD